LLGLSGTNLRIGTRDEFTGDSNGSNQFREGYLAYVNCAQEELGTPLWIKDGELCAGATREKAEAITSYDHCLVKLEWHSERNDYTTLPFHASWNKARDFIWGDQPEKARASFLDLAQQLAGSPDLTATHKTALLAVYRANFAAEVESHRATLEILPSPI